MQTRPTGRVRDFPQGVAPRALSIRRSWACRPLGQLCAGDYVIYGGAWPTVPPHPAPTADQSTPALQAPSRPCRLTSCWSSNAPCARHSSRSRYRTGVNGAQPHRLAIALANRLVRNNPTYASIAIVHWSLAAVAPRHARLSSTAGGGMTRVRDERKPFDEHSCS